MVVKCDTAPAALLLHLYTGYTTPRDHSEVEEEIKYLVKIMFKLLKTILESCDILTFSAILLELLFYPSYSILGSSTWSLCSFDVS